MTFVDNSFNNLKLTSRKGRRFFKALENLMSEQIRYNPITSDIGGDPEKCRFSALFGMMIFHQRCLILGFQSKYWKLITIILQFH